MPGKGEVGGTVGPAVEILQKMEFGGKNVQEMSQEISWHGEFRADTWKSVVSSEWNILSFNTEVQDAHFKP